MISPNNIIKEGLCIGCGSCASNAGSRVSMNFDSYGQLLPSGDRKWMNTPNEVLTDTCPFSPGAANENDLAAKLFNSNEHDQHIGKYRKAYVGYVGEEDFRLQGSSGGMVTWVATELLRRNLVDGVAHVYATDDPQQDGRYFRYRISHSEEEIRKGAKSRYYPVELSSVLAEIRSKPGRYAVIGIPCFIKAVQLLRISDPVIGERVKYTLGLFCGHMKSARFIESFAWQMNVPASEVSRVEFRHKDPQRPANWYTARLQLNDGTVVMKDWWHLADGDWGAGFFMNKACNYCDDVVGETADISFGDAWLEPYSSDGKGTNVVVVRSSQMLDIISEALAARRIHLEEVDNDFVQRTQAAGFRQRREGLAYRLTWQKPTVHPNKRVEPNVAMPNSRKLIYRIRFNISQWSHRMFRIAKLLRQPKIYIAWARAASAVYHGLAYGRGRVGSLLKRMKLANG